MPFEGKYFLNVPYTPSSQFWLFDPVADEWTAISATPNPGSVTYASVTSLGRGSVMLLGGIVNQYMPSGIWVLEGQTWVNLSLSMALLAHTTVFLNNTAFIFGGVDLETQAVLNTLYSLEVQNGTVVGQLQNNTATGPVWPAARFGHTAVVVTMKNSEVMAVYGGVQKTVVLGDLWVFNPQTSRWAMLYSVECGATFAIVGQPPPLFYHAAVTLSPRKMAIVGGTKCNSFSQNATFIFDFSSGYWSQLPTTGLTAVSSMSIGWIAEESTLLLFGGGKPLLQMQPACKPPYVAKPSFATGLCELCPNGTFFSQGDCFSCPPGMTCGPGILRIEECIPCAVGKYLSNGSCVDCPTGLSTSVPGAIDITGCAVCQVNKCNHGSCYVENMSLNCACDKGYFGNQCQVTSFGRVWHKSTCLTYRTKYAKEGDIFERVCLKDRERQRESKRERERERERESVCV